MKLFQLIKDFFVKKENIEYFLVGVTPRCIYENRKVGGMRITIKFVKTIKRFGKTKVLSKTETFNNYHNRNGKFAYNPPYRALTDEHSEDRLWHSILVWEDCENYLFAPISTDLLQRIIDKWAQKKRL